VNGGEIRGDRHALLELARIEALAADSDWDTFEADDRLRWVLHRLWIAVGNEALAYARLSGMTRCGSCSGSRAKVGWSGTHRRLARAATTVWCLSAR
jgi:hypothetical protein